MFSQNYRVRYEDVYETYADGTGETETRTAGYYASRSGAVKCARRVAERGDQRTAWVERYDGTAWVKSGQNIY